MDKKLEKLQEIIGYQFQRPGLLAHALTHSSYANERHWDKTRCNERLEFLGDAVLELVSSNFLYHQFPDMPEGEMTKLRASLVCEPTRKETSLRGFRRHGSGDRRDFPGWWSC